MAKRVNHQIRYDGATVEQVTAMLADPAFRDAVCEYQRYPRRTVTIDGAGAGMTVRIDQYRPATEVPSFARKLVGDEINILQEEEWASPTSAKLSVAMPGKPGEMNGTITLAEDANGVTETVEIEVRVSVPLIGGKLEGFIGDMLLRALNAENKVGREWLSR